MLAPESNPEKGFTDNHNPDYPGMETCLYCLFGDDHHSAGVGPMSVVPQPRVNKGSYSFVGSVPSSSILSHDTG